MIEWVKDDSGISIRDIERKQPYKLEPHTFRTRKRLPWAYCIHCGLLMMRNPLTEWCVRMGCNASDHPEYCARCAASRGRQ